MGLDISSSESLSSERSSSRTPPSNITGGSSSSQKERDSFKPQHVPNQEDTMESRGICDSFRGFLCWVLDGLLSCFRAIRDYFNSDTPPPEISLPKDTTSSFNNDATPLFEIPLPEFEIPLPEDVASSLNNNQIQTLTDFKSTRLRKKPIPVSQEEVLNKCWKNSTKAYKEHCASSPDDAAVYAPGTSPIVGEASHSPFELEHAVAEAKSPRRKASEDAHLYVETAEGVLAAIFDGHSGSHVAQFAAEHLQEIFFKQLTLLPTQIPLALELSLEIFQKQLNQQRFLKGGSTAVISYIDRTNNLIYTATLGDSEANLYYRLDGDQVRSIPLSCIRGWDLPRECDRLLAWGNHHPKLRGTMEGWELEEKKKSRKIPDKDGLAWLSVSRALGDFNYYTITKDGSQIGISQKPKITVHRLQRDDLSRGLLLVLACDGLKAVKKSETSPGSSETTIVKTITDHFSESPSIIAEALKHTAIDKNKNAFNSDDDVTILAIKLHPVVIE